MTPRDTPIGNTQAGVGASATDTSQRRALPRLTTAGVPGNPLRDEDISPVTAQNSQSAATDVAPDLSRSSASTPIHRDPPSVKRKVDFYAKDASSKRMCISQQVKTPISSLLDILRLTGEKGPASNIREITSSERRRATSGPLSRLITPSVFGVESALVDLGSTERFESSRTGGILNNPQLHLQEQDHASTPASSHRRAEQSSVEAPQDTSHVPTGEDSQKSCRLDMGCQDYLQELVTSVRAAGKHSSMNQNDGPGSEPGVSEILSCQQSLLEVWLSLYLPGDHPGKASNCVPIALKRTDTRENLFETVETNLEGLYDGGRDCIAAVLVQRADGEIIRGCPQNCMPIRRLGERDAWNLLVKKLLEHGGPGEIGLHAYVEMSRAVSL